MAMMSVPFTNDHNLLTQDFSISFPLKHTHKVSIIPTVAPFNSSPQAMLKPVGSGWPQRTLRVPGWNSFSGGQ